MKNLPTYILATALYALAVVLWLGPSVIPHADAARENDVWVERLGTYVESVWNEGRNVLINGSNKYLNFGSISGSTGYGFRDNGGDIQYKMSGGSWANLGSATLGDDSVTPDNVLTSGQTDEYCLTYEATGTTWEWQVCSSGSGDNVSVDSVAVTDPDFVSTGDIDFIDTSNTITANINAGAIVNADVNASAAIVLSKLDLTGYTGATSITTLGTISTGVWQATALTDTYVSDTITVGASGSVNDSALSANLQSLAGLTPASSLIIGNGLGGFEMVTPANFITNNNILDTADIGVSVQGYNANTSILGSTISVGELASADFGDWTCNGSTCTLDAGVVDTTAIAADTITHANIADSDQASTMCIYIEDPVAEDDLNSIWANKTANDFLLTEMWAESDQTVNLDLQVDDGTPADVNGTDISPAAGEAEDTSLSGDTTIAAGEELDLAITSVSGTPTWLSICWTGNWVD